MNTTNGMKFEALDEKGDIIKKISLFFSRWRNNKELSDKRNGAGQCYSLSKMDDIIKW